MCTLSPVQDKSESYSRSLIRHVANTWSSLFVAVLLHAGAIPKGDFTSRTALHIAASMDNPIAVSQLCAHGFDPLTKDKTGKTAVQLAVDAGLHEVLQELQACGAPAGLTAKRNHG